MIHATGNKVMTRFLWLVLFTAVFWLPGCGESDTDNAVSKNSDRVLSEQKLAKSRSEFDWSAWNSLPLLHDGRTKPIDTLAREICLLVTTGRYWEDPESGVRYLPQELLFAWISDPDEWAQRPVVRCEFQPLRRLLQKGLMQQQTSNVVADGSTEMTFDPIPDETLDASTLQVGVYAGEDQVAQLSVSEGPDGNRKFSIRPVSRAAVPESWSFDPEDRQVRLSWAEAPENGIQCVYSYEFTRDDISEKGLYIAADDLIDWSVWRDSRRFQYRCREFEERIRKIRQNRQRGEKETGDTPADRLLNEKVEALEMHLQAFIAAAEARNLYIVPGFDPRTLAKQFDTDSDVQPWVPLGSLLRIEQWRTEVRPDASIAAVMADSPADLVDSLVLHGIDRLSRELNVERSYSELKSLHERSVSNGILPPSAYPEENIAQLAVAQNDSQAIRRMMKKVAPAFEEARTAYRSGKRTDFDSGIRSFKRRIEDLAEASVEMRMTMNPPKRGSLEFGKFDSAVWAAFKPLELSERQIEFSNYPVANAMDVELKYNAAKPFERAWIYFLIAAVVMLVSYVSRAQRLVYSLGIGIGFFAIVYSAWGFMLRIQIAGRAPVTNMYETVIWVAFVVAVLGCIFALSPVYGSGMSWAWKLSGLPFVWKRDAEGRRRFLPNGPDTADEGRFLSGSTRIVQSVLSIVRIVVAERIIWFLTASDTSFRIITLLPELQGATSLGDMPWGRFSTWMVGISTVLISAWMLPRGVLCLLLGIVTSVSESLRHKGDVVWPQLLKRRFFMFPAMLVACLGMMLAHFVGISSPEILNPEIGSITAVLRNNYWLTIHVLTIVSSYGAGALAWGLGNLALCYYLFGRYASKSGRLVNDSDDRLVDRLRRTGESLKLGRLGDTLKAGVKGFGSGDETGGVSRVRPPEEAATLASYSYRVMQVAVLLLAAGTILGGLWADVSWGRFWDWDPKEVWALVSLLAYVVILHGRFAGWVGTFGTNVGSVVCFMAIVMSWYGVNFVLPMVHGWLQGTDKPAEVGLHSYATGAGGLEYVAFGVLLNLGFVLCAFGRFVAETKLGASKGGESGSPSGEEDAVSEEPSEEPVVV